MFGMGFMEIFLVLIVAVIALGPEKLPGAAVDIVKFFKKFKSSIDDAKSTLDNELNISEMKKEAEEFKSSVSNIKNITTLELDDLTSIQDDIKPSKEEKKEVPPKPKSKVAINDFDEIKVKKEEKPKPKTKVAKNDSDDFKVKKETVSFNKDEEI